MSKSDKVIGLLCRLGIEYQLLNHSPVFTVEDAAIFTPNLDAAGVKSLLLVGKTSQEFYLVVLPGEKRLNLKYLATYLNEKKLIFATSRQLFQKMKIKPGSVGIFGLAEESARDIRLIFDKNILLEHQKIAFHPNDNTKTVIFSLKDMEKILTTFGVELEEVDL